MFSGSGNIKHSLHSNKGTYIFARIHVLIPIIAPLSTSTNGPPELPGLIADDKKAEMKPIIDK